MVSQWHLKRNYCYVGSPLTSTITGQFTFRVEDDNNPPNQSEEHIFYIKIHPIDDLASELFPGIALWIPVWEYKLNILNKDMLHFTDLISVEKDLWYTIIFPSINQEVTQKQSFLGHSILTDSPDTIFVEFTITASGRLFKNIHRVSAHTGRMGHCQRGLHTCIGQ